MRVLIIFTISTCFCLLITCRPANDENSSDAEYEGNDDVKQDEYISEDQEPASDDVQRASVNHNDRKVSQDEFSHNNRDSREDQNEGYKEVSDADLNDDKEARQDGRNINANHENFLQSDYKTHHSNTNRAVERNEELSSLRDHAQKLGSRNFNAAQNTEFSGDLLFKISQENLSKDRNDPIEIDDQPNPEKQHYSKIQTKHSSDGRTYENSFNIRDRRETQNHQSEPKNSDAINESNESSIINNIKKLSDKDLENLLNALPEDKKAILKKIMDKREITKKAGAVDDHGLDPGKLEGSFSIDSKTISDLATGPSETNKQGESEESSTKTQENDNDSGKTENKSSFNANTNGQTLEFNVEAATLSNYDKDNLKNDNKREINSDQHRAELQEEVKSGDDSTDDNSYDLSSNQEFICSDNEDWLESRGEGSNTQKRQINNENVFENDESIRSLEESFPNSDAYDDRNLNMEPLIRVKRTELKHKVKKRDLCSFENEVPFVPSIQDKKCENIALNEFEDKSFLNNPASYVRSDRQTKRNTDIRDDKKIFEVNNPNLNKNSQLVQTDQYSTGSKDELSSVEGVDSNIMYNSDIGNKVLVENHKDDKIKLVRSGRTIDPINSESHVAPDNSVVDTPSYQAEDSFESLLEKSENNLSRSKRI